jgi:hypothetical protein
VQQEQPDVVNGHLLDFLADLAPGANAASSAAPAYVEAGRLEP